MGVKAHVAWPKRDTEVEFRGCKLVLRPASGDTLASVAFQHPESMSLDEVLAAVLFSTAANTPCTQELNTLLKRTVAGRTRIP
jgi:hypothetical protein